MSAQQQQNTPFKKSYTVAKLARELNQMVKNGQGNFIVVLQLDGKHAAPAGDGKFMRTSMGNNEYNFLLLEARMDDGFQFSTGGLIV